METKEYRLTDVCDFQGGTQPPKEEWINEPREGYVRMLQIRDFTQDKAEHVGYVKDTKKLNKCKEDDILIGRYGASVGKILTGLSGAYNVAIIKTIPNEKLLSKRYLYYVLTGTDFQNFILNIGARAAQAGFNKSDLSLFKLHIPVLLEDQERAANALEKAKCLLAYRERSIHLLSEFLKMKFVEMFGDNQEMANSELDILGNHITYLTSGSRGWAKYYSETGAKFLRIQNIGGGKIREDNLVFVKPPTSAETDRTRVREGDLIISITADLGRASVVPSNFGEGYINQHLALIRVDENINPTYAAFFYNMPFGNNEIQKKNRAAVKAGLNFEDIKSFPILIPNIEEQNKFARIVSRIELILQTFESHKGKLLELNSSLSQKALCGELEISDKVYSEVNLTHEPKISNEVTTIGKIDKELEEFHKNQPHTAAPDAIYTKKGQLQAELKIRGEVKFDSNYVKYRIVKEKFKDAFTFEQLWQEITKFPFETLPKYDDVASIILKWLEEEHPFIKQSFNKERNQIELTINETAEA